MKADLHIHSSFSDGLSSPEEIVDTAIERGINCISIVDHGEVGGAIKAMKFGFDKDILVLPGIEILSTSGDILGINIKKIIPDGLSAERTVEEIRRQKGFVVLPHLFHWPTHHFQGGEKKILNIKPEAIEVFNASVLYNYANRRALNFAQRNNLSPVAGSDAHRAEFIGRGYIEIFGKISSAEGLLEEVRRGRVKIKGRPLNYLEIFRNFSKSDPKKIFKCLTNRVAGFQ